MQLSEMQRTRQAIYTALEQMQREAMKARQQLADLDRMIERQAGAGDLIDQLIDREQKAAEPPAPRAAELAPGAAELAAEIAGFDPEPEPAPPSAAELETARLAAAGAVPAEPGAIDEETAAAARAERIAARARRK